MKDKKPIETGADVLHRLQEDYYTINLIGLYIPIIPYLDR
jgi:hypothetical protein